MPPPPHTAPPPTLSSRLSLGLQRGCEGLMCLLVFGSPWAFGAVEPFDFYVYLGVGLMAALWALRLVVERRLTWKRCPIVLILAALFLIGVWQVAPLPQGLAAALSPAGAALKKALLPSTPEQLQAGEAREKIEPPVTASLSLYPARTKQMLVQLLALLLFYSAVRNNCASMLVLKRMSILAVVNGSALAFLGLLQFATSDLKHLYWTIPSPHLGYVFGPFLCRSHFPFYLNLCIGLGLGLLFSLRFHLHGYVPPDSVAPSGRRRADAEENPYEKTHPSLFVRSWSEILRDGRVLWLCFLLVLMACSVACSLSRGGLGSLLAGGFLGAALGLPKERRGAGVLLAALLVGGVAFGLSWLGFDLMESRHATLLQGEGIDERLEIWKAVWPLAADYPLTGAGYGAFMVVEPLNRLPGGDTYLFHSHAHNEYLEALVEGGWPRLAVTVLLLGVICWLGFKALSRYRVRSAYGLTVGALIALATAAVQSGADFGLHIPAIALLSAAIAAQISAVALDPDPHRPTNLPLEDANVFAPRLLGLAPFLAAALLLALAFGLVADAWRNRLFFMHEAVASHMNRSIEEDEKAMRPVTFDPDEMKKKADILRAAIPLQPESAFLRIQFANALSQYLKGKEQQAARMALCMEAAAAALGAADAAAAPPLGVGAGAAPPLGAAALAFWSQGPLGQQLTEQLRPVAAEHLKALLAARDLCPLLPQPHLRIAENITSFASAEPRSAYLARAKRLRPFDAELWLQCGTQEWLDGQYDEAARSWRRCLELKNPDDRDAAFVFARILVMAGRRPLPLPGAPAEETLFTPEQILAKIVPDQPRMLLAAVRQFFPKDADKARRKPYLEKVLALLSQPKTADELHTQAMALFSLDRMKEGEAALERALAKQPTNWEWRDELAAICFEDKRYAEAVFHLEQVARQRPDDEQIKKKLEAARVFLEKAADQRRNPMP